MSDRVEALARRVEDDPDFLASALAAYARAEGLSDVELAKRLGCLLTRLSAIRLCRTPRSAAGQFQQDVDRIAAAFQIDSAVIADAVRLSEALRALGATDERGGYLMAARDRTEGEADEDDGVKDEP
jgi:hypothetical protein